MSGVPSAPSFGASESIQNTVEKEMRRRKLLVGLFVILLLVPVGVAALFLFSAPKAPIAGNAAPAKGALPREVQVQVENNGQALEQQKQQIMQLDQKLGNRDATISALQQQVSQASNVALGTKDSLSQLSSSQAALAQQVKQQAVEVQQTRAVLQQAQEAAAPTSETREMMERNAALPSELQALRSQVAALSERVQQVQQQNTELQKQVTTINKRYEIQPIRPQ